MGKFFWDDSLVFLLRPIDTTVRSQLLQCDDLGPWDGKTDLSCTDLY